MSSGGQEIAKNNSGDTLNDETGIKKSGVSGPLSAGVAGNYFYGL
jgi:hypothetical protein